jgi:hypothetical protein
LQGPNLGARGVEPCEGTNNLVVLPGDGSATGRSGAALLARNPHCKRYNVQRG